MNYYEILEVSVNASKEVIKNAYRALTKKYHPDSYKGNQEYAQENMKEINEAYETLIDDNKRLTYDYENGFKIDPNAPKEELDIKEETNIKVEEKDEKKEDKLMTFIKEKKMFIAIGIVILFVIAFIIGIAIAGSGNTDEKDNEDEVVVNDDSQTEDKNTTNNTNTYRPNNNNVIETPKEDTYTQPTSPEINDDKNEDYEGEEDETIKEPDGIS